MTILDTVAILNANMKTPGALKFEIFNHFSDLHI